MTTEKEKKNRLRCLSCEYYGMNVCPLMADGDVFNLDICILNIVKKKKWAYDSPEMFMFRHDPLTLLHYLTYKRMNKLPKVGTKVLTLRSGFGGGPGLIRWVARITPNTIELRDSLGNLYLSQKESWYLDFFAMDNYN